MLPLRFLPLLVTVGACLLPFALKAKPLQVLVGMNKPPYIRVDTSDGFEIELLRAIVAQMQYDAEFTYVPNKRIASLLQQGIGDIATLQKQQTQDAGLFYSCPYIRYQNVAVTLLGSQISLAQISDLKNVTVLAFQNASQVLPDSYKQAIQALPDYRETVDQRTQVELLQRRRVQVVIMDVNIFRYYNDSAETAEPVQIHPVFAPTLYRAGFRDKTLMQRFNKALQQVKASKHYQLLQERYFGGSNNTELPPCNEH